MELRHLRSFVVLAEEMHFTRAAHRLNIVQPALSGHIRALEEETATRLFDRDRRNVRLTAVGELFLTQARVTLEQAQRTLEIAQRADSGELGTLRIGFVSSVIPTILPYLIKRLRQTYPHLVLELHDMNTPKQLEILKDGRMDFGFVRMPSPAKGIKVKLILEEQFMIVVPRDHPLSEQSSIGLEELEEEPLFWLARRAAPGYCDALLGALSRNHFVPKIVQEFDELHTMVGMVASGIGLAIVPSGVAMAASTAVIAKPLSALDHRSQVGLAWKDSRSSVAKRFLRFCNELPTDDLRTQVSPRGVTGQQQRTSGISKPK